MIRGYSQSAAFYYWNNYFISTQHNNWWINLTQKYIFRCQHPFTNELHLVCKRKIEKDELELNVCLRRYGMWFLKDKNVILILLQSQIRPTYVFTKSDITEDWQIDWLDFSGAFRLLDLTVLGVN